jgi:hypothetical protein
MLVIRGGGRNGMDRNKKKSDDRKPPVVNVVEGDVLGVLVQAGVVYGGVHVHHRGAGPVPVVTPVVPLEAVPPELFVGRSSQVEDLLAKWSPEVRPPTNVSVVAGMGGVGKTVLVRHTSAVAVQRGWFSGGALLVDMQGYKPAGDRRNVRAVVAGAGSRREGDPGHGVRTGDGVPPVVRPVGSAAATCAARAGQRLNR